VRRDDPAVRTAAAEPPLYNSPFAPDPPRTPLSTSTAAIAGDGAPGQRSTLESELAALLVQALNLDLVADQIDPATPLFVDGLGLDSIDVLELALEVSQRYGLQLRADDEQNQAIFQSLRTLAAHVAKHRTK